MHDSMAKRMRKRRLELGLQTKFVASAVGVSNSTYSDWENGRGIRDNVHLVELSRVLSMGIVELLTGESTADVQVELARIEDAVKNIRLQI